MTPALSAEANCVVLQSVSVCLQHPDARVAALFPTVRAAVTELPNCPSRERLAYFLDVVDATPPLRAAAHHVEIFDTRRRCCPYLTWWSDGETRRRGASLAAVKQRYREAGFELAGSELPDYLPVVCEYAATADLTDGLALLQEHRPGLELLRLALHDADTPYVAPLEALCALLPGPSPRDVAEAKALARSGPPREQVGLDLAPFTPAGG